MTEQEVYKRIKPLLEGSSEGIFWDFKKTLFETSDIIKDILAFSNSDYEGDSYIIVGVSEPDLKDQRNQIKLTKADRIRLNTDSNYIYLSDKWNAHGLNADEIVEMKQFSAKLSEQLASSMLISQPHCEYVPVRIGKSRWLYVIIIKKTPGVFISKKDIPNNYSNKPVVKQGVIYIRIADITIGARTDVASAAEHIRIWKKYINWLNNTDLLSEEGAI